MPAAERLPITPAAKKGALSGFTNCPSIASPLVNAAAAAAAGDDTMDFFSGSAQQRRPFLAVRWLSWGCQARMRCRKALAQQEGQSHSRVPGPSASRRSTFHCCGSQSCPRRPLASPRLGHCTHSCWRARLVARAQLTLSAVPPCHQTHDSSAAGTDQLLRRGCHSA